MGWQGGAWKQNTIRKQGSFRLLNRNIQNLTSTKILIKYEGRVKNVFRYVNSLKKSISLATILGMLLENVLYHEKKMLVTGNKRIQ